LLSLRNKPDHPRMNSSLIRKPSAFLPLLMSLIALMLVIVRLASGTAHVDDEDAATHVFQLLIAGQAPVVALFAARWLPREPAQALMMIAVQAGAALMALAPVVLLDL
jgi:hypothetical protein